MKAVTYGKGTQRGVLENVYDRLRKRSYRRMKRQQRLAGYWRALDAESAHQLYLSGVRDALNETRREEYLW